MILKCQIENMKIFSGLLLIYLRICSRIPKNLFNKCLVSLLNISTTVKMYNETVNNIVLMNISMINQII